MLFVVLEDCKTKEGKGCDNKSELLGICVRKYDVYFGYDNIENILLDPAMADLACSNQIDSLPIPKQLGINPLSTKTYGKYTLNDECYTWDKYPSKLEYHMANALYNRQSNTNIYKQMALRVHLWVKFNSIIVQIPCPAILFAHFHLY